MKKIDLKNLSPKQKQAGIVLAICALAIVVTLSVTAVMVSKAGKSWRPASRFCWQKPAVS